MDEIQGLREKADSYHDPIINGGENNSSVVEIELFPAACRQQSELFVKQLPQPRSHAKRLLVCTPCELPRSGRNPKSEPSDSPMAFSNCPHQLFANNLNMFQKAAEVRI